MAIHDPVYLPVYACRRKFTTMLQFNLYVESKPEIPEIDEEHA